MCVALASQKAYMVVYLSVIYADVSARAAFELSETQPDPTVPTAPEPTRNP